MDKKSSTILIPKRLTTGPSGKDFVLNIESGHFMIVDPVHVLSKEDYADLVDRIFEKDDDAPIEFKNGIVSSNWFGDGHFPVHFSYDNYNKLPRAAYVIFDPIRESKSNKSGK